MTYTSTPITIDDREPDAQKYKAGLSYRHIPSQITRLVLGDFSWTITANDSTKVLFLVERKTTSDLLNSIKDGRLGRFVDHTSGPNEVRILLIESQERKMRRSGFNWKETGVDNILLEAQMRGVYVVQCQSGDVASRIAALWNWSMKPQHRSIVKPKLASVSKGYLTGEGDKERKRAVQFLLGIPTVGEVRALQLLAHFKTPSAIISAALKREYGLFKGIPGVSKPTIDAIANFLEKEI